MVLDEQQKRLAEELFFKDEKIQSFAKKLYFGTLDTLQGLPYPSISKEKQLNTQQFIEKLQGYLQSAVDPVDIDRNAHIPQSVVEGLGKLGLLGLTIPSQYGGMGMSQYAYCKAMELVASHCGSTAIFVNAHQSIGLKALLLFGTEEQKCKWLPPLAKGEQIAAFSLTEPNAGSDASGVETRAIYDPEKNVYRINGKKQWTTNGSIAKVLTVMAQTQVETSQGRQDKITAFLVTPDMAGFCITAPALEKVGIRGTRTTNLEFKNLEVPPNHVLGPIGGGLKVCLTVLDYGRTTFGASCTGIAKVLLEKATYHARTRYQFKRPLASFSLVKEKIARMAALTYAMEATTYLTAGFVDAGIEDFMLEAAMLKVFTSDALWSIIYDTMQIFGGRSFFTTEPYERIMRDARLNMIGEGSNEVMRAFIGAVGMRDVGMELKKMTEAFSHPVSEFNTIIGSINHFVSRFWVCKVPVQSTTVLSKEAQHLSAAIRKFGFAVVRVLAHYREEVIEKQLDLNRIATCAIAIYTAVAVISKIDRELMDVNQEVGHLQNDVAIAKLYCHQAITTVNQMISSLFDPMDQKIESLSDKIIDSHLP